MSMDRRRLHQALSLAIVALVLDLGGSAAWAGNIDPASDGSQYAWGENVGWINFQPFSGPGVTVTDSTLTGFAWGENIGWINLSPASGGGVANDGLGHLSGSAWGENTGWINFAPTGSGVFISACGEFNGRAWGENIGWISFRSNGPAPYRVTTSWMAPVDAVAPVTSASGPGPGWNTTDVSVTLVASDCGAGVGAIHYTLDSDPEVVTPGSSVTFSITSDGIHALSYFSIDLAGNPETPHLLTISIDKTAPLINLSSPVDGASYYLDQSVAADFTVTEAGSGLAGVTSTAADGSLLVTSVAGPGAFNVSATDQAGNSASVTHNYAVVGCPADIAQVGIISTFAGGGISLGDGEPATAAQITTPVGVDVDLAGNVFVSDPDTPRVRRIAAATGIITTVAGTGIMTFPGTGDGGPATAAGLAMPWGVATDRSGNLYIADFFDNRIRRVDGATGIITTFAGTGIPGYDGDNGPATQADLFWPQDVAVDDSGDVYIADSANYMVRKVSAATGIISRYAGVLLPDECGSGDGGPALLAGLCGSQQLALDRAGNLYVVVGFEPESNSHVVRRIDVASGIITRFAGGGAGNGESGRALDADLGFVSDIDFDDAGNLIISSSNYASSARVFRVDRDGNIGVFAGTGELGYAGDGGPAIQARFGLLGGLGVGGDGDVYIGDMSGGGNRGLIRRVTVDLDGDDQTNCIDSDDDNDGISDAAETAAGSDPLNPASRPEVCDGLDNDLDGQTDEGFAHAGNVGPTLRLAHAGGGSQIQITWTDTTAADDYVVYQDSLSNGSFTTVTGTAVSGTIGLTVPTPAEDVVYFRVAGRNAACGEGPKN